MTVTDCKGRDAVVLNYGWKKMPRHPSEAAQVANGQAAYFRQNRGSRRLKGPPVTCV